MIRRLPTLSAAWLWVLTGLAGPAPAQDVPFTAVVTDQTVPVRAGAGRTFYQVGQLERGSQVTVDEVVFGWYKIKPPEGSYSYVSMAFVDAFGDGRAGKVNTDRAAVRAASVNGAGESYRRQIDLLRGQPVQIVGQEGSFYKITPPDGAYVFLPPASIRPVRVDGQDIDVTTGSTPTTETLSPAPTVQTESGPAIPSTQPSQAVSASVGAATDDPKEKPGLIAASQELRSIELKMIEAQGLPLEQQPIGQLLDTYEKLAHVPGLSLVDRRIVSLRIMQLRRSAVVLDTLRDIALTQKENEAISRFADELPPDLPKQRYDVRGQLLTSSVYNGKNLPRLYRITEADGHRIVAYARLHPTINPATLLGRYVGVIGKMKYDPMLRLEVIEVQQIDEISLSASR